MFCILIYFNVTLISIYIYIYIYYILRRVLRTLYFISYEQSASHFFCIFYVFKQYIICNYPISSDHLQKQYRYGLNGLQHGDYGLFHEIHRLVQEIFLNRLLENGLLRQIQLKALMEGVIQRVQSLQQVLKKCQVERVIRLCMMLISENLQDMVRLKVNSN